MGNEQRTTHTDASARRVALASDAFHAHLDACDRCRTHPFNLCAFGEKLLLAFGDAEALHKARSILGLP